MSLYRRARGRWKRASRAVRGYTLVALLVGMTVMAILMAAALPIASTQVQREREEELIFRGLQYAEGIRLYRKRYGRYPNSLKEMFETRPRTIRKLWKDPITNSMDWGIVGPGGTVQITLPGRGPGDKTKPPGNDPGPKPLPTPTPSPFGGGARGNPQDVLPVAGIHSKSSKKSFRQFQGRDTYSEWVFTEQSLFVDRRTGQAVVPGGGTGPGGAPGGGGGPRGGGPGGSEIPGMGPGK
ncbi:MAG: type II secretion system protein [Acidobacteria bacterium]|nr:type II secretion system protein [Acidobacteriota bacterium]MCG3191633.1 hypothetical protein [Thermoanaerobaculia bacterium]